MSAKDRYLQRKAGAATSVKKERNGFESSIPAAAAAAAAATGSTMAKQEPDASSGPIVIKRE
jgi:hypothetical protein